MIHPFDSTQATSAADKLEYAIQLAKAGQRIEARDILRRLVALQPVNQRAWLWLSALATDAGEAKAALAQARRLNPRHPSLARAEQWLVNRFSLQSPTIPSSPVVDAPPSPKSVAAPGLLNKVGLGLVIAAILVGITVLALGIGLQITAAAQPAQEPRSQPGALEQLEAVAPALEAAQSQQSWGQVIALLEPLHQADPAAAPVARQLSFAYWQKGLTLRHRGYIEQARSFFEQALAVTPDRPQAQRELELAQAYLQGTQAYQNGQWPAAIEALEAVEAVDKDYVHLKDLLYSAYFNHALALQGAGQLAEAKTAFETAIALRPDLAEPRLQLARIEFALAPAMPPPFPLKKPSARQQLVVVGLAEQRMHVYQEDERVFDFVVSTGEPGRDTAIGDFEILNKIDVAYASTWNLDMPYWMGIYWSGPLQNGIHSLPIVKHTGYKLWDGYLGQRVSYGCVILSDEDAATLYNWVEIGARVKIVPSLDHWTPKQ
ncbi:MAG: L,D-transpeptidase family protein [Chloroflexota bacterium]